MKYPTMKKIHILIAFMAFLFQSAEAQTIKELKKAAERGAVRGVLRGTERQAEKKTEKAIDKIANPNLDKKGKEDKDDRNNSQSKSGDGSAKNEVSNEDSELNALSETGDNEVGFKRGSLILYTDNFSQDAIGDFPAKWNTSGSGEVKRLSGHEGNWFRVPAGSVVNLETTKSFPQNFTIEFDLIVPGDIEYRLVGIGLGEKPQRFDNLLSPTASYGVMFYTQKGQNRDEYRFGTRANTSTWKRKEYKVPLNKVIRMAIEVNNHQRIRTFVDGIKMTDEPRAFSPEFAKSFFLHATTHGAAASKQNYFYISNVVIAETGLDERSSVLKDLIEKGSFTTTDIHFASGSDKIEPRSAGILNEIGDAMKSSPGTTFIITGHTDSDGTEATNQVLSEKRAAAVKNYLVSNKGIPASDLLTNGKGETEPVADNSTSDGKAQNRRVEFKKI